eukprot:3870336-Heterocapsa_arctica.AAC.1
MPSDILHLPRESLNVVLALGGTIVGVVTLVALVHALQACPEPGDEGWSVGLPGAAHCRRQQ